MKPEDKKKLQDAWRKATDQNPNADKPVTGLILNNGKPPTPRNITEAVLADDGLYEAVDKLLADNPSLTLDKWLKIAFAPAPKKPGPKP